jgi:hypothetical protein
MALFKIIFKRFELNCTLEQILAFLTIKNKSNVFVQNQKITISHFWNNN